MTTETMTTVAFDTAEIGRALDAMGPDQFDELDFGIIGFDAGGSVRVYNRLEAGAAGLSAAKVVGRPLFTEVAPCMNNYLVAQRFDDAQTSGTLLDVTIDYVLTLRMRPVRVALRLVSIPGSARSYVLIRRNH
jgi:photoactive yellow protein